MLCDKETKCGVATADVRTTRGLLKLSVKKVALRAIQVMQRAEAIAKVVLLT